MSNEKEMLEATLKGLQDKVNSLNTDINMKRKELEDINKPEMTGEMFDKLHRLVEDSIQDALGNLHSDDIEKEFGMEYDGKVYLESISIQEDDLIQYIMGEINNKFKIK